MNHSIATDSTRLPSRYCRAATGRERCNVTYLITFSCYGSKLHGNAFGSIDRNHNVPGGRMADSNPQREMIERTLMRQEKYSLDRARRIVVLDAMRETCEHRNWALLAAHVRTNHVHAVIEAE